MVAQMIPYTCNHFITFMTVRKVESIGYPGPQRYRPHSLLTVLPVFDTNNVFCEMFSKNKRHSNGFANSSIIILLKGVDTRFNFSCKIMQKKISCQKSPTTLILKSYRFLKVLYRL